MSNNQTNRRNTEPMYLKMQRAVDTGLAASVIHRCLKGEEIKPQRLQAALVVYNKTVPSLAAIQVEVNAKTARTPADLLAEAQRLGVNPAYLFDLPTKSVIEHEHTPEETKDPARTPAHAPANAHAREARATPPTPEIDE